MNSSSKATSAARPVGASSATTDPFTSEKDSVIRQRSESQHWRFPPITELPAPVEMIRVPADLSVNSLLSAYRSGYFPMPVRRRIAWFSPNPRGVFLPGHLRVTKSLERSARRFEIRVNTAFTEVITACGDPARPLGWINRAIIESFTALHLAGHAHSVEAWDSEGLAGGLYGVCIGGFFAGESMFHRRTDASKVTLLALDKIMGSVPGAVIDTQWTTDHLVSLGAFDVTRNDYARLLKTALEQPTPARFELPS